MRNNLTETTIGNAPIFIGDGNYSSKYPKASDFLPTGVPFITASDFRNGRISSKKFRFISEKQHNSLLKGHLKDEDVLIVTRGNGLGNIAFVNAEFSGCNINAQLVLLRPEKNVLFPRYLYFLLKNPEMNALIKRYASGSAQPQLPIKSLSQIPISYPELHIQKSISRILGTLDDKIELNRKMNETLEAIARMIFKSWFVDFDPVRAKAEGRKPFGMDSETAALFPDAFQDSELGQIPRGWEEGKIEEIISLNKEIIKPEEHPDSIFDHFSIPSFDDGQKPKQETGSEIKSNKFSIPHNSVLISKLNPRIPRIWLPNLKFFQRPICSTEFLVAIPNSIVSREFIYCLFRSGEFWRTFSTMVTGTSGSHQRVKPEYFLNMDIIIPPQKCIDAFTSVVKSIYEKIGINLQESQTLALIRDNLLPKLLSGEIRIIDSEIFAGEA